jgi:hypothetical protein
MNLMRFEWYDRAKAATNIKIHGISFETADAMIFLADACRPDFSRIASKVLEQRWQCGSLCRRSCRPSDVNGHTVYEDEESDHGQPCRSS